MAPFDGVQSPSQGPRHTKDVLKMVPVVPLFSPNFYYSVLEIYLSSIVKLAIYLM